MPQDAMSPTLREYIETQIRYERTLVDQRFEMLDRALILQAEEYKRRLDALNHAHAQAVVEQQRTLPRELHEAFIKEYDFFRMETAKQLQANATRSTTWVSAIGLLFLIVQIIMRFGFPR